MPIRNNIANLIDTFVNNHIGNISVAETAYKTVNPRYKGELHSHNTIPENGNDAPMENPWTIYALPGSLPVSASIHLYSSEGNEGWYLEVKVRDLGTVYLKRWHGAGSAPDVADFPDWTEVLG